VFGRDTGPGSRTGLCWPRLVIRVRAAIVLGEGAVGVMLDRLGERLVG